MFSFQQEMMIVQLKQEELESSSREAWKYFVLPEEPKQNFESLPCCHCTCEV